MSLTAAATVSERPASAGRGRVADGVLSVTVESRRSAARSHGYDQPVRWSWTHLPLPTTTPASPVRWRLRWSRPRPTGGSWWSRSSPGRRPPTLGGAGEREVHRGDELAKARGAREQARALGILWTPTRRPTSLSASSCPVQGLPVPGNPPRFPASATAGLAATLAGGAASAAGVSRARSSPAWSPACRARGGPVRGHHHP